MPAGARSRGSRSNCWGMMWAPSWPIPPYEQAAAGLGGVGFSLTDPELVPEILAEAQAAAAERPVLVNALIGRSDFRKGSVSV